jgi:hypothetical protein
MVVAQASLVQIKLGPGHTIRGRIVNRDGKPLEGVRVEAANWKRHSSLDWTTKTDAEGRFAWDSAPQEPVFLTMTKPGYTMVAQQEFPPDKSETNVTMYPPLRIRGKVNDATTGKPIEQFKVVHGNYYRFSNRDGELRNVNWERGWPQTEFIGGKYEVECSHAPVVAVALRFEAKGFKPATSEPFKMEAGDVAFDAKLEPGIGPRGVAHGADGRPLAGASVILSTKSLRAQLYNGKFHEGGYPQALTEADGRFSFPAQSEPFRLFVDHASGFAEADEKSLAGSPNLSIQPWGRIAGTVKIGSRPAAGVQIRLSETDNRWAPDEAMPITQAQQLKVDSTGRYAFEHVIPARLLVSRIFTLERSSFHVGTGAARTVDVKPDKTTWVDLGGTGRPLVGRFTLPAGINASAVFHYLSQTLAGPDGTFDTNVRPLLLTSVTRHGALREPLDLGAVQKPFHDRPPVADLLRLGGPQADQLLNSRRIIERIRMGNSFEVDPQEAITPQQALGLGHGRLDLAEHEGFKDLRRPAPEAQPLGSVANREWIVGRADAQHVDVLEPLAAERESLNEPYHRRAVRPDAPVNEDSFEEAAHLDPMCREVRRCG